MVLLNTELEINQSMQILMDRNGHHGSVQTKAETTSCPQKLEVGTVRC